MPVRRSEPRSGNGRVGNQGRFRNIVGGVLSPLLANISMRRFILGWKELGHEGTISRCNFLSGQLFPQFVRGQLEELAEAHLG